MPSTSRLARRLARQRPDRWCQRRLLARFAESRPDRLSNLARELAQAGSRVIVTSGTTAVSAVDSTLPQVPVVIAGSADPVLMEFAKSLARPGGTVTGISILGAETQLGKSIELLKELVPSARTMIWRRFRRRPIQAMASFGAGLVPPITVRI